MRTAKVVTTIAARAVRGSDLAAKDGGITSEAVGEVLFCCNTYARCAHPLQPADGLARDDCECDPDITTVMHPKGTMSFVVYELEP